MGYYTQYKLQCDDEHRVELKYKLSVLAYPTPDRIGPDADGNGVSPFIDDDRWGNSSPGCKWYSQRSDCKIVSSQMEGVEFEIQCLGEGNETWCSLTYLNGVES